VCVCVCVGGVSLSDLLVNVSQLTTDIVTSNLTMFTAQDIDTLTTASLNTTEVHDTLMMDVVTTN